MKGFVYGLVYLVTIMVIGTLIGNYLLGTMGAIMGFFSSMLLVVMIAIKEFNP